MNKKYYLTALCLATALVLTGCAEPPQDMTTDSAPNIAQSSMPAPTSPRQSYEEFTSISSAVVEGFAKDMQKAFKKNNWEMIGSLIEYPITIDGQEFSSKEEFLAADPDKLIPKKIRKKITKANVSEMKVAKKGASLGDGELVISDCDKALRIIEINVKQKQKNKKQKSK